MSFWTSARSWLGRLCFFVVEIPIMLWLLAWALCAGWLIVRLTAAPLGMLACSAGVSLAGFLLLAAAKVTVVRRRARVSLGWIRMSRRATFAYWLGWVLMFAGIAAAPFCIWLAAYSPRRPMRVTISKATTYITAPLLSDGYPDYAAAIKQQAARLDETACKGVTPQNNAAVLLWQALGPKKIDKADRQRFFQQLGIPPLPEAGDYWVEFGEMYARLGGNPQSLQATAELNRAVDHPWSKADCPVVAKWLAANERPLALVIEASRRPRYYSPAVSAPRDEIFGSSTTLEVRDVVNGLMVRAMLQLHDGKVERAWADLLACHCLARLVGKGAAGWDVLSACAIDTWTSCPDRVLVQAGKLSSAQARRFRAEIRRLPPLPSASKAFDPYDRLDLLAEVCRLARDGPRAMCADQGVSLFPGEETKYALAVLRFSVVYSLIDFDHTMSSVNSLFDQFKAATAKPAATVRERDLAKLLGKFTARRAAYLDLESVAEDAFKGNSPVRSASERMANEYFGVLLPALLLRLTSQERAQTQLQLTDMAFALAAYRSDHGQYPADLAKLVPKYLDELPTDHFTGAKFVYKREGKGYVLYSLGPNGFDDGGRGQYMQPPPGASPDQGPGPTGDDVGFRVAE